MSYTYLITGATSDVGRALIERLLQNAPADTLVLAQGCGDLEKLADKEQQRVPLNLMADKQPPKLEYWFKEQQPMLEFRRGRFVL